MSGAGQPPKGGGADPAMDDILASIRRILNEDEAAEGGSAAAPEPEPLDLTEAMLVEPPPRPEPEPEPEFTPPPRTVAPEPEAPPPQMPEGLVAPAVAMAATAALGQLLRSVAADRAAPVHRGGPSIEDVVREELRPLLKEWLDQHLPPLVERLARVEIERVIGRVIP